MFQTLCAGMENKNREEGGDRDVFFFPVENAEILQNMEDSYT